MSFWDEWRRFTSPADGEDDDDLTEEETSRPQQETQPASAPAARRGNGRVVNIGVNNQQQVVLLSPRAFTEASEIADHIRDKRTVMLNLEKTEKGVTQRLVDFLSGVAYALEGKIKRVAVNTYIITPYNVDIVDHLEEELENGNLYF